MFDTEWNAHQIDILIICFIGDNLPNTSSTPPSEGEKKSIVYSTFNDFVCLNKNFYFLEV